ncbi:MAG: oxaloacetate decarboxylase subunit alpha [Hydrogenophilales bacterium 16-64-46]|nr:MAG: oxaloacetate decarboxylase subunit alpha [Hydrogenophilales bacterium 12-64-13]OYZ04265.1 MAG: oxaloacetate decarboxylase subunit alpha [Hydrogenophilales bacterium 16-64-46]OZA38527.1 MAG: oxaloacetate decarboxylase subunit alpha [Hydrogenophilales bacterium 17-64-34]HQT00180.1 sodium-extruding oxaloacetate decarboxylase subunit alpha [Thiobacillus sp.]
MAKVFVTDLVLRDGHQSLIATRMQTADMLPICSKLDSVGFWSLEAWGGATFDACVRFLREDPWERLRKLRKALPNTRIQMLLRGQNLLGYRNYPDDVVRAFVQKSADNGVDVFRVFDAMNDLRNLRVSIEAVKAAGKHAEGAISYTTSPVHDIPHFVELAKGMAEMGCDTLAIKDMAALLTPYTAFELVRAIREATHLPVHTHSHATSGLAAMTHLKAVEAGATIIDTCIGAFAEGASHPTTQSLVAALAGTEYDTGLSLPLLEEISAYFKEVRRKYWQFESEFTGTDTRSLVNQVPGGMISNLANQLKEQGAIDKMDAVLEEIPRVREDLGYPPLVTPTSQIVGTQAALNVLTGARYKSVTNEVKLYLQGRYGAAPGQVSEAIRKLAIGDAEVITCRPADLLVDELDKLRGEIEHLAKTDEDVLTYAMFPEIAKTWLQERAAGSLKPEPLKPKGAAAQEAAPRTAADEFKITLHGETYLIKLAGSGRQDGGPRPYFVSIDGVSEEVLVEALHEVVLADTGSGAPRTSKPVAAADQKPRASHPGHVTAAMPGSIVEVLVQVGQTVKAGDGVLVIEAMKMENEVQAPIAGVVISIFTQKGDAVTPDMALVEIQPE